MKVKTVVIATIILLFCSSSVEAQCAMCRAVLESDENSQTAKGVNNGIMYLMVFPYLLVGTVAYLVYRNRQKTT